MPLHRRSFHLHVVQASETSEVRWSVTRSYWTTGQATRSSILGSGTAELTAEGGTPPEVALCLLQAALAHYGVQLHKEMQQRDDEGPHGALSR